MTDRPIPFSGAMIRALLAGTKTQTRRAVKGPALEWLQPGGFVPEFVSRPENHLCPHGAPGDRLWVREAWRTVAEADGLPPRDLTPAHRIWFEAEAPRQPGAGRYRPPMFMPRWASRILLEVTDVSVERLQHISEADAIAEGIERGEGFPGWYRQSLPGDSAELSELGKSCRVPTAFPKLAYRALWEAINGPGSWEANPWVWCVSFRRVTP